MILIVSREEKDLIRRLRSVGAGEDTTVLSEQVVSLKRQIADLQVSKSKLVEDFEKRERELTHKIGLEQRRQEQDRANAEIAATHAAETARLDVEKRNLASERKQFEEQLKFNTERFKSMEVYLKDMFSDVLARLPNVNVEMDLGAKKRTRK